MHSSCSLISRNHVCARALSEPSISMIHRQSRPHDFVASRHLIHKVVAKELEPFHLLFIEEPVLPENIEALREIAQHTSTPIATGERMYSRWDYKKLLQDGYVDILQPDLS